MDLPARRNLCGCSTSVGQDAATPYEATLPPSGLGVGNHTIEARAYDAAGNTASDWRNVTVTRAPPGSGPGAPDIPPWIVLALVVAAVAAAVAILLVRRRRPRGPGTREPPTDSEAPRPPR